MHSKSDKIQIMISAESNEVINKLFDSLKNRYQNNLELMKDTEFVFDYVQLVYYKCHKINLNRGGSQLDSPDWIKQKKTIKKFLSIKKDKKWFQYTVTVVLNYKEIKKISAQNYKTKAFYK